MNTQSRFRSFLCRFPFQAIRHAWQTRRRDSAIALVVFVATVGFAPHVGMGLVVGAAIALAVYLLL